MNRPNAKRCPRANATRRAFLQSASATAGLAALATAPTFARHVGPDDQKRLEGLGIPGPFPGRVVEVQHPGSCPGGTPDPEAVRRMVRHGIGALTGIEEPVEAWRSMFEPGDVVGIKVNPVGNPLAISNYATVHALVEGLESAGVKRKDIIVFERYKDAFLDSGYKDHLPDGCQWDWAAETYTEPQLDIERYDPDVFVELPIVHAKPGIHNPKDERTRRSHLSRTVTQRVNKIIGIPVLKDHGSGGVTLALKNMSHGFVNNVSRSHGTADTNTCNLFIPAIVSHPIIRQKVVLQVLDGLNAVFQGGPGAQKPYVWQYEALFFATDPVAMDHVCWEIVDAKRVAEGLPPVAELGRKAQNPTHTEGFDYRQPQHIPGAAALGLGVFDKAKIDHKILKLGA